MSEPLLEVKNLKKYFPITAGLLRKEIGAIKAVDGIDFTVYQGQVMGLVGESGSGKSTAARAAIRLIEPTSGEIHFMGKNLLSLTQEELREERKNVQIVFQDPFASLNPRQTIGDSIGEALLYHGVVKTKLQQREHVAATLLQVGLSEDVMNRYPHQFSGGQQQRICIGRAIALRPKLIVCDEAVSALDVSIQAQILNLLIELKNKLGLSYLFISHDLSVVRYICDWVSVLYKGKIVESNATEEIFKKPIEGYTKALISAIPPSKPMPKH